MIISQALLELRNSDIQGLHKKNSSSIIVSYMDSALAQIYYLLRLDTEAYELSDEMYPLGTTMFPLPFDVIHIIDIADSSGESISHDAKVQQAGYNKLQILDTGKFPYYITYTAAPEKLLKYSYPHTEDAITFDPLQEIPLPDHLIELMYHYVAYKANIATNPDIKGDNNTHLMRFKSGITLAIAEGVRNFTPPSILQEREDATFL